LLLPLALPIGDPGLTVLSPTAGDEAAMPRLIGTGDADRGVESVLFGLDGNAGVRGVEKVGCTFG
jgi:hypothetical protein